jgi:ParB family chromosome partitioning protein
VVDDERSLSGHVVARSERFELQRIPLQRIHPRPDQPRRRIDPRGLEELTRSVSLHGVLQPIRVRRSGDESYEIVAGERRWRAARGAGLQEIPAIVVDADDERAYVEALIENIQREELNAVDRAHALTRLRVSLNLRSWQQVGEMVGITRQHIHNLLNVTRLPDPIREDVRAGELTEKHARALMRLQQNTPLQHLLWERIHSERLSGRAADEAARLMVAQLDPAGAGEPPPVRSGLAALAEATAVALSAAPRAELESAAASLTGLHRRLGDLLGVRTPPERATRAPEGGAAEV